MLRRWMRKLHDAGVNLMTDGTRDAYERWRLRRRFGLIHFAPHARYVVVDSRFGRRCRLGGNCLIRDSSFGDYSYAETGVRITYTRVGNFCSIGPGATIGLAAHPTEGYVSTHPAFYLNRPVLGYDLVEHDRRSDYRGTTLGHDVWIGANALVKDGITIGDGAIIGAGAVVTKDVEPYAVVAGVPAKAIRKRFDDVTIARLQASQWWTRDDAWLRRYREELADVTRFVETFSEQSASEGVAGKNDGAT